MECAHLPGDSGAAVEVSALLTAYFPPCLSNCQTPCSKKPPAGRP